MLVLMWMRLLRHKAGDGCWQHSYLLPRAALLQPWMELSKSSFTMQTLKLLIYQPSATALHREQLLISRTYPIFWSS